MTPEDAELRRRILEFDVMKAKIRKFVDEHPWENRINLAREVGGTDPFGGITEEFLLACAEVIEDLFERHNRN